jgi:hypothetical protein
MAENIGGTNPFSSGGHRWAWGDLPVRDKRIAPIHTEGAINIRLGTGPVAGAVVGVLKTAGHATRALADQAMTMLEDTIQLLVMAGQSQQAEDDAGHTIDELIVDGYARQITDRQRGGNRAYFRDGSGNWACWQRYVCRVTSLTGVVTE